MPKTSDILSGQDLEVIARRKARAKAKARRAIAAADPEEDARVVAAAKADPDSAPLRDTAVLRPAHEVHPALVADRLRRGRGRPRLASPKRQVTMRLDADLIESLRATGPGWQVRVNDALRKWLRVGRH
jgi:uncharacterized protein (DUF4415 family)